MLSKQIKFFPDKIFLNFKSDTKDNSFTISLHGKPDKGEKINYVLLEDGNWATKEEIKEQNLSIAKFPDIRNAVNAAKKFAKAFVDKESYNIVCNLYLFGWDKTYNSIDKMMVDLNGFEDKYSIVYPLPLLGSRIPGRDDYGVFCPLCGHYFDGSEYLKTVFDANEVWQALWFANMVMHYRHNHITSWNKCWGYRGNSYRYGWFGDYDDEKAKVNERAKRQILRKAKDYLKHYSFTADVLEELQNTTEETMKVAHKILD